MCLMDIPSCIQIVEQQNKGKSLLATEEIPPGRTLFDFKGIKKPLGVADPKALQVDEQTMLESTREFDDYVNHSCDPNTYVRFGKKIRLVSLRPIEPGEEVTFNYNTTEYDLIDQKVAFFCQCGSPICARNVRGYSYLSLEEKERIKKYLSPFLRTKYTEELRFLHKALPPRHIEFFPFPQNAKVSTA